MKLRALLMLVSATTLLGGITTLSGCIGPGDRFTEEAQGSEKAAQAARIEKDPKNVDHYRDAVMLALRTGDEEEARRLGLLATQRMPNDYRAWLVKAQMERSLLDFGPCEASLQQALGLAPDLERIGVLGALADFYGDVLAHDEQLSMRERAVETARASDVEDLLAGTLTALVLERRGIGKPHGLNADDLQRLGPATRLGVTGPSAMDDEIDRLTANPTRANMAVMARLVGFATPQQRQRVAAGLNDVLSRREDPDTRFACLQGLWLNACLSDQSNDPSVDQTKEPTGDLTTAPQPAIPVNKQAEIEAYTSRLDELDAAQPVWLMRAVLWDRVNGREDEAKARAEKAARRIEDLPYRANSREEVFAFIRFEDALAMGWYGLASQELAAMDAELFREGGHQELKRRLLLNARDYPELLAQSPEDSHPQAATLRIPSLLAIGKIAEARAELDRVQPKEGSEAPQPEGFFMLKRLVEYHERRVLRSR